MYSITLFYVDHIAQMFVKVYGDRFRAQQQMLRWLRQKLEPWPTLCSDMKRPFFAHTILHLQSRFFMTVVSVQV